MIKNKIKILKKKFNKFEIDGYIVPKNDDDFEFNQDFEIDGEKKSPGWIRYQKRIK